MEAFMFHQKVFHWDLCIKYKYVYFLNIHVYIIASEPPILSNRVGENDHKNITQSSMSEWH